MPLTVVMTQKPRKRRNGKPPQIRVAGHFGEFLQGRLGPNGPVALITLPCPVLAVTATRRPGAFTLHQPDGAVLSRTRAAALLRHLGLAVRGRFILRLNLPVGGGAGSSTAALVALARAAGADEDRIAAACLAVEGASDPLMLPAPGRVLWASRLAWPVMTLPAPPLFEVLGGFYGPPRRTDPQDVDFPDIADLAIAWPGACADAVSAARLASLAAARTLALRGPADDPTETLARSLGALGHAIAHTGSARALLFRPGTVPAGAAQALRAAGFTRITRFRTGGG